MRRLAPAFRKIGWQVGDLPRRSWERHPLANLSSAARESREDARESPQHPQETASAGNAGESEQNHGTSPYAGQEKNAPRCGEPMTIIEPGQLYHPTCQPGEDAQ